MGRRLLICLSLTLLLSIAVPAALWADAAVVQDSCVVVDPVGPVIDVYFTVVNFSLPAPICDVHFIPEPQPPEPYCEMIGCSHPAGWSCFLNPFGGADYFANTPVDCIDAGSAKGGFSFRLDPSFCCYIVQFTDPTGAVMLEQEECFTCKQVPTEDGTWGRIKDLYKE